MNFNSYQIYKNLQNICKILQNTCKKNLGLQKYAKYLQTFAKILQNFAKMYNFWQKTCLQIISSSNSYFRGRKLAAGGKFWYFEPPKSWFLRANRAAGGVFFCQNIRSFGGISFLEGKSEKMYFFRQALFPSDFFEIWIAFSLLF